MAKRWSPEDEEGFGIRGADTDALTAEQQKALDDLRVQTARDNQEYLHDHPEVKAMLSLLIRETLLQERDVRSVAGELFRSEKRVVAAVRKMLGMEPLPPRRRRGSDDVDPCLSSVREVAFSDDTVRKGRQMDEVPGETRKKRRDTPAPWIQQQLLEVTDTAQKRASQLTEAFVQQELEKLVSGVDGESSQDAGRQFPWVHSGKSGSQLHHDTTGDVGDEEEEEVIPLARRDTPAPWSVFEIDPTPHKGDKEKYVLGLLDKIIEEPSGSINEHDVFQKLQKIVEEAE